MLISISLHIKIAWIELAKLIDTKSGKLATEVMDRHEHKGTFGQDGRFTE
jgi:hypothetical protein